MTAIATWGSYVFDDTEVTKFSWDTPNTEYIEIPRITGYPTVQQVGDTLGSVSIGLRFTGSTAKAKLNTLRLFAIGTIAALTLGSTGMGNYYQAKLTVDYEMLIGTDLIALSVTLELKQES